MIDFLRSSIGKKLIMSLSGLFLVVFLVVHVLLNLAALVSRDLYETACHFMDENIFIRIMVPVLAAGFIVHIIWSIFITLSNQAARPVKYAVTNQAKASSWASKNMFVLGLIVVCLLAVHLTHFWAHMQCKTLLLGQEGENPYELLIKTFSNPINCGIYVVWAIALYYHLSHGFWSAFQSIGLNNSKWIPRLQILAKLYAVVVAAAFIIIPLYFYFGMYKTVLFN